MKITTTIDVSGPFFTHDPAKTFLGNVHTLLEAIAQEGQQDVDAQLEASESGRAPLASGKGRVRDFVRGRVESIGGKPWHLNVVISPDRSGLDARDAIGLYAAASRIEGREHVFRRTTTRLRRGNALNRAELTKGLE